MNPTSVKAQTLQSIGTYEVTPELKTYVDAGFKNLNVPKGTPFGGVELTNLVITSYYRDLSYYRVFGSWHEGIDMIPSNAYYSSNPAFLKTKQPIIFATMNGRACSYGSIKDGYTVTIVSPTNSFKTLYNHQSLNFIPLGSCLDINAGQPIGIMGSTGNSTGPHVHYMTYKSVDGNWVGFDPYSTLF